MESDSVQQSRLTGQCTDQAQPRPTSPSAIGQKMWQRTDGTILWLRSHLIVRLELPLARQHEAQLKIKKDQKARASVPKF